MSKRLLASMVSIQSQEPEIPDTITEKEFIESALSVEEAAIDINEHMHELNKKMMHVEEMEYALESLERIHHSMESQSILTQSAARGYQIAFSNIIGNVLPNPIASLESFKDDEAAAGDDLPEGDELSLDEDGNPITADEATVKDEAALEAEKGSASVIQQVLEKLKAAWARAREFMARVWKKLIGAIPRLKRHIAGLQSRIKQIQSGRPSPVQDRVKVPRAASLVLGGKLSNQIFKDGFGRVQKEVFSSSDVIYKTADTFYTAIERAYKQPDDLKAKVTDINHVMIDGVKKASLIDKFYELPGGRLLSWSEPEGDGLQSFQPPTIDVHPDAAEYDEDGRMELFTISDMDRYAKQLYKFVLDIEQTDRKRDQLDKKEQAAEKAVSAWAKTQDGNEDSGFTAVQVTKIVRGSHSNLKTTLVRLDNYLFNYCRVVAGVLEAHLNVYQPAKGS